LFSILESIKDSIRQTAKEFLTLMPAFAKRLAERDYDFILMNPMKRRMLLKMYCMGKLFYLILVFLNLEHKFHRLWKKN
jgi:hypothetical protein